MGPLSLTDPTEIDGYRLRGRLGAGAMGVVYDAVSPTGATVALKTLDVATIAPVDLDDRLERFGREAKALKKVKGESLVRVLAANPNTDPPYLVTTLVEGLTLAEYLTRTTMPTDQAALLGMVLAEGLTEVHAEGLVHRDLKPANIILGSAGPVLVDFGLVAELDRDVRLSGTGMVIGTPLTMAPEQAEGRAAGSAADIHGLGAVLVRATTGHAPYGSTGKVPEMLAKISNPQIAPDLSGVPDELAELVQQMLAHDQQARPAAPEVLNRLRAVVLAMASDLEPHEAVVQARKRFAHNTFVPTLTKTHQIPRPGGGSGTSRGEPPRLPLGDLAWLVEELRRGYDRSDFLLAGANTRIAGQHNTGGTSR